MSKLIDDIQRLTKEWIISCDDKELEALRAFLRGEKND